jgi:hypothetical protein
MEFKTPADRYVEVPAKKRPKVEEDCGAESFQIKNKCAKSKAIVEADNAVYEENAEKAVKALKKLAVFFDQPSGDVFAMRYVGRGGFSGKAPPQVFPGFFVEVFRQLECPNKAYVLEGVEKIQDDREGMIDLYDLLEPIYEECGF